jgi:RimJ/RimL family protein N-acetyltransferase
MNCELGGSSQCGPFAWIHYMTVSWVLESDRLRLREFAAADDDALICMHSDPHVRALLLDDYPLDDRGVAREFIARMQALYRRHEGLGIWYAERKLSADTESLAQAREAVELGELSEAALAWMLEPDWAFCGWFNLMPMPDESGRVEIGCRLRHEAWGLGLAVEGGAALLDHAFGALALDSVWATCDPRHRSVHLVLQTLGFSSRGLGPYERAEAAWFAVDVPGWAAARRLPLRQRQRAALRSDRMPVAGHQECFARAVDRRGVLAAGPRSGPHEDRSQLTN